MFAVKNGKQCSGVTLAPSAFLLMKNQLYINENLARLILGAILSSLEICFPGTADTPSKINVLIDERDMCG